MSTPKSGLSFDIESQKSGLVTSYLEKGGGDDEKSTGIRVTVVELAHKPTSTLTLDGVINPSHKSSQKSFLIWTLINTLATIGIVNMPSSIVPSSWDLTVVATANQRSASGLYK